MGEAFLYCVCRRTHTHTLAAHFSLFLLFGFSLAFLFSVANQSQVCTAIMIAACTTPVPPCPCSVRYTVASLCGRLHAFFAHLMYFASFFPVSDPLLCALPSSTFCLAAGAFFVWQSTSTSSPPPPTPLLLLQRFCFLAGSCSSVNNFIISATLHDVHTHTHVGA